MISQQKITWIAPNESLELPSLNENGNVSAYCKSDILTRILKQAALLSSIIIKNPQNRESDVQLTRINLSQFDGKIEQWKNFYEMFKSLIDFDKWQCSSSD